MPKPTKQQREMMAWIRTCISANGHPPTVMEVGAHFGMSSASACVILTALEKEGYLERCLGFAPRFQPARPCPHCGWPNAQKQKELNKRRSKP